MCSCREALCFETEKAPWGENTPLKDTPGFMSQRTRGMIFAPFGLTLGEFTD